MIDKIPKCRNCGDSNKKTEMNRHFLSGFCSHRCRNDYYKYKCPSFKVKPKKKLKKLI